MTLKEIQDYLLSKPATRLDYPFGPDVQVYKVKNKMFATLALGKIGKSQDTAPSHWWMNLKCEPNEALILRDIFPAVIPGYHMNKRLWNTVVLDDSIPKGEIERMIDNSYLLVVNKMTKKEKQPLLMQL